MDFKVEIKRGKIFQSGKQRKPELAMDKASGSAEH